MDSKKPWFSKTLWVNLAVAILALFGKEAIIAEHAQIVMAVFAVLNIVLRFATKGKIEFFES